jgi:hypothetical protein
MTLTLPEIKELVDQLAERIGAPQNSLPTYGNSEQGNGVYVEVDSKGYQFIAAERGKINERYITPDIDDLLYKIFEGVTFGFSCQYELAHRIEEQDCRRIMFQHQVELLSMLSPQWGERERQELNQILMKYPFDDFVNVRASLCVKLKEQGYSTKVIEKMAYEQYPLPKREAEK